MSRHPQLDPRIRRRPWRFGAAALAAIVPLAIGLAAHADRVVTKGVALEGTVKRVSSSEVEFETVYGEGTLTIPIADLEAIETGRAFHVIHGDGARTVGPLVGVGEEALRVRRPSGEVEVPLAEIHEGLPAPEPDENLFERLDVALPYWSGRFDLAFAATQATDDSLSLSSGLSLERAKGPHRTVFGASYRLGTQHTQGEEEETTANELYGRARHEYEFTERWFAFGSVDGEYDEVESLSVRTNPKAGLGYSLYEGETAWLKVDGGFGWVYERFFGGEENAFPALALGAESDWELPVGGVVWHSRVDYTPSLEDLSRDYLLRAETSLLVPLWDGFSFRASLIDAYDSTPAEGREPNSLSTLVGLSYGF